MKLILFRDKTSEHDDSLLSLDMLPEKGLILSACGDGFVKVWNQKKEMIREIQFNQPIVSAVFLNSDADIIVGHSGQISVIHASDYDPFEVKLPSDEQLEGKEP